MSCTTTVANFSAYFYLIESGNINNYIGDGISGIYIWVAQVEQGTFPTSYIPTTTAVTRIADLFTVPTGSWFDITKGSLYLYSSIFGNPSSGGFQIGVGGNATNYMGFPYTVATGYPATLYYRASGAGPYIDGSPSLAFDTPFKIVGAYSVAENFLKYAKNGVITATGNGVTQITSATKLHIGGSPWSPSQVISGYIQKVKYYPARVPDIQLQLMTQ